VRVLPAVLNEPGFRLFWLGTVFSQIGTRGTVAANLWQVLQLTNSTLQVGLVGLAEALALLLLAPLGGAVADRMDRRTLLQVTQSISLLASLSLTLLTFSGLIQPWHIYTAVVAISAAQSFEGPARQALIPALVRKELIVDAFALVNPTRELAILIGPAFAGVFIATVGAGWVYAFDAFTYGTLVAALALIALPRLAPAGKRESVWRSIITGFAYVKDHRLIWQLMSLDFAATFFIGYRVLLPSLARDVLNVGASGYGLLVAAPAAGAIMGSAAVFRMRKFPRKGALVLAATVGYAVAAMLLAHAPAFGVALVAAGSLGVFDAITTTLRQAVVQLDTPDELRGRVTSAYQMVSRGGPSLGQAQMGVLAAQLGAPLALTVGASVTMLYAVVLSVFGRTVRDYRN
ncbi:MAG TPA: MFS transporter, partial [Chloroflexota bacterium]|nr:MFS transporter [Chloroflexota bacterium]